MQFYDFRTTRDLVAKGEPIDKFYDGSFTFALDAMQDKRTAFRCSRKACGSGIVGRTTTCIPRSRRCSCV